jgi:hypothetical protein
MDDEGFHTAVRWRMEFVGLANLLCFLNPNKKRGRRGGGEESEEEVAQAREPLLLGSPGSLFAPAKERGMRNHSEQVEKVLSGMFC